MLRRALCLVSIAAFLIGCGPDDPASMGAGEAAGFSVRGSVAQIHVWKAPKGAKVEVHDANDALVKAGTTDDLGSIVFRDVPPGEGYSVILPDNADVGVARDVRVMSSAGSLPASEFYSGQTLMPGYNYITTRDGTKLAAYVTLPGPPEDGPYPTIVNYSGYNPAEPGKPIGEYDSLCGDLPILCDAPNDPSALIGGLMNYATVGVNMRGTGCSGGAYDYFEELQLLDGYDIIETVAAQPWVKGHKVGMSGISFPGISQLFVSRKHPPSLAAITPLSVIGNTYTTGDPGGIFNDGFALEWITTVLNSADPYGQGWEQGLVDAGDTICEENQLLHGQKLNAIQKAKDNPYYTDDVVGPVNPTAFVNEIDVPVFLAGAWQDEQTGPFFFTLLDKFKSAPTFRFTTYNGVHADALAPQVLVELKAFLDTYVNEEMVGVNDTLRTLAPVLFQNVFHASLVIPPDRFTKYGSFDEAKAAFEAEQPYRAIFENGGTATPGAPVGTFDRRFDAWPPPSTQPMRLYFHADGSLSNALPSEPESASTFTLDPTAGEKGILPKGDVMDLLPGYVWEQPEPGSEVTFVTDALDNDLVMLGTGSVDLWVRSPVNDADLEVNLSEVRPDGQEMFVQSGWLRASLRKLAPGATSLWPEHTYRQEDEALLVPGQWTAARVGIAGFSHVFRKGSKIRIAVDTPGASRVRWRFDLKPFPGTVSYDIAHSSPYPSSVVLPVLTGEPAAPQELPPCPSLRGQQCREYMPYTNVPAAK